MSRHIERLVVQAVAVGCIGCCSGLPVLTDLGYDRWLMLSVPLFIALLVLGCIDLQRTDRRKQLGQCIACGYDLRGSPGRCSECGTDAGPPRRSG